MPFTCARGPYTGNQEPTLDEALADPVVRLMMMSDGVEEAELRWIAAEACKPRGNPTDSVAGPLPEA